MTPTLSQVKNWDTEHLTAAANHWSKTAQVWEDCFTTYAREVTSPGGTLWEGTAAEAAQQQGHSDRMTVIGLADRLHDAAAIARAGAHRIDDARRRVLRTVETAERAGFSVEEDFSVQDRHVLNIRAAVVRHKRAVSLAAELRETVGDLVAEDSEVASTLTTATTGLGAAPFGETVAAPGVTAENAGAATPEHTAIFRRSEPIDPTDWRVGDERFGHWEDVAVPSKPWIDGVPPPLTSEMRLFTEESLRGHTAGPTEWFVPGRSWIFDSEAPLFQLQEQYMIRINGTEATPHSRLWTEAGTTTQQRWVRYTYEMAHKEQGVVGGGVRIKGKERDIGVVGAQPWSVQNWTPTTINDIARLSAQNPTIRFNIPDGCGGQFAYTDAVPKGGWIGKPAGPPIMTRPR